MKRMMLASLIALAGAAPLAATDGPVTPPLMVYAAGSTTGALGAILKRYGAETGQTVDLKTGPAGLMREAIEKGDAVDLYVSANMAHPQKLHADGRGGPVAVFARNRLCVTARHEVGMTSANMLDRLLDPKVRIGTSTPGADPGGDYAQSVFERADHVRPGATALLKAKARAIVGGQIETRPAKPGTALDGLDDHAVDVTIGYCSSRSTTPDTTVDKVTVPPALSTPVDYGMTVLTTSHDARREAAAGKLARYLRGREAQQALVPYGFQPAS